MSESTELQRAVENLTGTLEKLRDELVRKDVYAVDQRLMSEQIKHVAEDVSDLKADIQKDRAQRVTDRRLMLTSIIAPIFILILSLYLSAQTGSGA